MKTSDSSLERHSELTMSTIVESKSRPGLMVKLATAQFFGTVVFCLVLYFCTNAHIAVSAFLGGSIAALTSLYMAARLFTDGQNAEDAPHMLARFYSSVVVKVVFTLMMMAICIVFIKVSVVSFIFAYLLAAVVINLLFLLVPTNDVVVRVDRSANHEKN